MQGDDEAVQPSAGCVLVVVLGDQAVDRRGEFGGERGPVAGGGEADLAVDAQRGQRLAGRGGAGDQFADLGHQSRGYGQ